MIEPEHISKIPIPIPPLDECEVYENMAITRKRMTLEEIRDKYGKDVADQIRRKR